MSIQKLDLIKKRVENKSNTIFWIQIIYLFIIGINNVFVHYKLTCLYPLDFILVLINLLSYKIYLYNGEYSWKKFFAKNIRKIYYFRVSSILVKCFDSNNYENITSFFASLLVAAILIELLKKESKGKFTFFVVYIWYGLVLLITKKDFLDVFLGTSGFYILIEWIASEDFVEFYKKFLSRQSAKILSEKIKDKVSVLKATSLIIVFSSISTSFIKDNLPNECKVFILEFVKYGFKLLPGSVEISSIHNESIIGNLMLLTIIVISISIYFSLLIWINSQLPEENKITLRQFLSIYPGKSSWIYKTLYRE